MKWIPGKNPFITQRTSLLGLTKCNSGNFLPNHHIWCRRHLNGALMSFYWIMSLRYSLCELDRGWGLCTPEQQSRPPWHTGPHREPSLVWHLWSGHVLQIRAWIKLCDLFCASYFMNDIIIMSGSVEVLLHNPNAISW